MAASRADQHDLDKLVRWRNDLENGADSDFPLHALFLVSEKDRSAHDAFRAYRSRFEELGSGFQHLVIFGQHGVSQAEKTLLARLGLQEGAIPNLVLLTASHPPLIYTLPLPSGDEGEDATEPKQVAWSQVLARVSMPIEGGAGGEIHGAAWEEIPGVSAGGPLNQSLLELVVGLLEELD